jgi:hypothetical protein
MGTTSWTKFSSSSSSLNTKFGASSDRVETVPRRIREGCIEALAEVRKESMAIEEPT